MSSPHYPQSNGNAESAVKAMKRLVQKASPAGHLDNDIFNAALLEWRNSPNSDGLSPAEVIFGRQLRELAPSHQSNFIPQSSKLRARIISRRGDSKTAKRRYDVHARPLRPILSESNNHCRNYGTRPASSFRPTQREIIR